MKNLSITVVGLLFIISSLSVEAVPVTLESQGTTYKISLFAEPDPNPPSEGSDYLLTTTRTEEFTIKREWQETELLEGFVIKRLFFEATTELLPEFTKQKFIWDDFLDDWTAGAIETGPDKSFRTGFEGFKDVIVSAPEPTTFSMLCIGLVSVVLIRRSKYTLTNGTPQTPLSHLMQHLIPKFLIRNFKARDFFQDSCSAC